MSQEEGVGLPRESADLRGSPGNFRGSLANFRGTSGLLFSSTVRELPGKSPKTSGEVRGTSGEVLGLSRSSRGPDSLPATHQICLQVSADYNRRTNKWNPACANPISRAETKQKSQGRNYIRPPPPLPSPRFWPEGIFKGRVGVYISNPPQHEFYTPPLFYTPPPPHPQKGFSEVGGGVYKILPRKIALFPFNCLCALTTAREKLRRPHSTCQTVVQGKCPLHFLHCNGAVGSNTLFSNTSALTNPLLFMANSTRKGSRTPCVVEHFWVPILGASCSNKLFVGTLRPSQ